MTRLPLRYSLRSLGRRPLPTILTVAGIAVVVALFAGMVALGVGMRRSLTRQTPSSRVLVTSRGTIAESMSAVPRGYLGNLLTVAGVSSNKAGQRLVSPEAVGLWTYARAGGRDLSLAMRGVSSIAYSVRPEVRVTAGRRPRLEIDEAIVGRALLEAVPEFSIGKTARFGAKTWTIVGTFEAEGAAIENELWAGLENVMADTGRDAYSSIVLVAKEPDALVRTIAADRRMGVKAQTESDYDAQHAQNADTILGAALMVAFVMGFGAVFGAMNTMFAALAARGREIAVLRAIGFQRSSIALGLVAETVLMALPGGAIGCGLALFARHSSVQMMNAYSFSSVAFHPVFTPGVFAAAMGFAACIGVIGGAFPAWSAATKPVSDSLRQ